MLCLYGTTKRLVPRSKGYAVTGSLDNSVHALFALQVSGVVRHNPISQTCTSSHVTVSATTFCLRTPVDPELQDSTSCEIADL